MTAHVKSSAAWALATGVILWLMLFSGCRSTRSVGVSVTHRDVTASVQVELR